MSEIGYPSLLEATCDNPTRDGKAVVKQGAMEKFI